MRVWWLVLVLGMAAPAVHAQGAVELAEDAQDAFFRGVGLLEADDAEAALAAFDEAASIQPDFRRVYYYRARALASLGRTEEALESLDAYQRFDLPEHEVLQARELRDELAVPAAPSSTTDPAPDAPPPDPPAPDAPSTAEQAEDEMDAANAALAERRCGDALAASQRAMRLDPGRVEVFLIKGLALECAGELARARSVLVTYVELSSHPESSATEALDRIASALRPRPEPSPTDRPAAPEEAPPAATPRSAALGDDPRIQGLLEERFGTAEPTRGRRITVPGVGPARYRSVTRHLAGSRTRGEELALWEGGRLVWARIRVDDGGDSPWFGRAFDDLLGQVVQDSGEPDRVVREVSPRQALAGQGRYEAVWSDEDGDRVRLRLGRCASRGPGAAVLPDSAPCLELTAASGTWSPNQRTLDAPEAAGVALVRTPHPRAFDFSVGLGGGGGFGFLVDTANNEVAFAPEVGADLLVRFSIGAFAAGFAWSPSAGGFVGPVTGAQGPFFESRVAFYAGVRGRHRQAHTTDVLFGGGFLPQTDAFGLPTASGALSFRVVDTFRKTSMGSVWVSFEPWVMIGSGEVRVVPMRFTVGGAVGTKPRLAGGAARDVPWGPLFSTP